MTYPPPPRDEVGLTDAQRAAFGILPKHQVEFCSTCHSGTRLLSGEVVHNPLCTAATAGKEDATMNDDEAVKMPPPPPAPPSGEGTAKKAAPAKKAAAKKVTGGTKKATTAKKAAPKKAAPAKKAAAKKATTVSRSREEAQKRDEHVLATLKRHPKGMTREQLRDASGAGDLTYMSLWRLHKAKRVEKRTGVEGSKHPVWFARG